MHVHNYSIAVVMVAFFYIFIQESLDIEGVASGASTPQPLIMWNGSNCYLIVEKEVLCTVPATEAAVALLGAYYVFDIRYSKSFGLVGTFLEIVFLDVVVKKVPSKVSVILSALSNV